MAADAWKIYHSFKAFLGEGYLDLDADEIYLALFLSTSNCATLTNDEYGDLTNQLANGNGYTTGGNLCSLVTWTDAVGTETFDMADVTFTASGGTLTFRFGVLYINKTVTAPTGTYTKPLIGYTLFDNTPADISLTTGNSLVVQISASGLLTLSGGS